MIESMSSFILWHNHLSNNVLMNLHILRYDFVFYQKMRLVVQNVIATCFSQTNKQMIVLGAQLIILKRIGCKQGVLQGKISEHCLYRNNNALICEIHK